MILVNIMIKDYLVRYSSNVYVKQSGPPLYVCIFHGIVDKDHVCVVE